MAYSVSRFKHNGNDCVQLIYKGCSIQLVKLSIEVYSLEIWRGRERIRESDTAFYTEEQILDECVAWIDDALKPPEPNGLIVWLTV